VTKRERWSRIQAIRQELVARIHKKYPRVEHLQTEIRASGMIAIDLFVPYANSMAVLECVMARVVKLIEDEGLHIVLIPLSEKPIQRAA